MCLKNNFCDLHFSALCTFIWRCRINLIIISYAKQIDIHFLTEEKYVHLKKEDYLMKHEKMDIRWRGGGNAKENKTMCFVSKIFWKERWVVLA